jgi:hypothetical protein
MFHCANATETLKMVNYPVPQMLKLLEAEPNTFDATNGFGWTCLHWAARYSKDDYIIALIEAGADANVRTTSEMPWRPALPTRDHDGHHHPVAGHHARGELSFPPNLTPRQLADYVGQHDLNNHHGDGTDGAPKAYLLKHHGAHHQANRALRAAEIDKYDEWKIREHQDSHVVHGGESDHESYRSTHHAPHVGRDDDL